MAKKIIEKQQEMNKSTEGKIIDAAIRIFAEDGYKGASVREICKLAEINISMISYYFGDKKGLYEKAVKNIVEKVIKHMKSKMGFKTELPDFESMPKEQKLLILYKILDAMIDYFYSDEITDSEVMLLCKEQLTSGVKLNSEGYAILRKLLASILGMNENDKEIAFRTLTIIGQVQSPRIMRQFSLGAINQSGYSKSDIQMLKRIITEQIALILKGIGA